MTVTKSQKIWLGVLGVAVAALAVNQLAGGPAAPPAGVTRPVGADPRSASPAVRAGPTAAVTMVGLSGFDAPLAARLDDLRRRLGDGPSIVRDAFAPPAAWAGAPSDDRAAAFEHGHVLTVTLQSGGGGQAVVDGDLVAVGQQVDGFRLASVGRRRATFVAADGTRAELSLPGSGGTAGR